MPRRLYRADGPHALTDADAVKMRSLGLVTVIDLRTAQEAQDRGRYVTTLGDVVEHHLPMIDVLPDTDELPDWIDPDVVARQYRNMLEHGSTAIATASPSCRIRARTRRCSIAVPARTGPASSPRSCSGSRAWPITRSSPTTR